MTACWFLKNDALVAYMFGKLLLRDAKLGVQNTRELMLAEFELQNATNSLNSEDVPIRYGFPIPRLVLPDSGFAPDYLSFSGYYFCSRRLQETLAQPEHVVQFTPVEVTGGPEVRAQDYRLRRVLARQRSLDLDRTQCEFEEYTNRITGKKEVRPCYVRRFALLNNLHPRTEIFRVEETPSRVLAVDAVAARVLAAGCTGIEFADPGNPQTGKRVERYRTKDGIAERRVGFLD